MVNDIIAAISTPPGRGGVAVVRLSGAGALGIAENMFSPAGKTPVRGFEPYRMYPGSADCGAFRDFGLCVYFKAPHSFTGEDVVEFHCHGGTAASFDVLNKYFGIACMPVPSASYWNMVYGKTPEEVMQDAEGLQTMRNIGRNIAWMLKCIEAGRAAGIECPVPERSARTNFIR